MEESEKLILDQSDKKNRKIRAKKNLRKGQVILSLEPLVCTVFSKHQNLFCNYCLKEASSCLSACSKCRSIYYCSVECQKIDWSIHKLECSCFEEVKKKSFKITNLFSLSLRFYNILVEREDIRKNFELLYHPDKELLSKEKQKFYTDLSLMLTKYSKKQIATDLEKNLDLIFDMISKLSGLSSLLPCKFHQSFMCSKCYSLF